MPDQRVTETLSIIIPICNEAEQVVHRLSVLQAFRARGHELIVVDGESDDDSLALAAPWVDVALSGPRGRARQMNLGATVAVGAILVFLHLDTALPDQADVTIVSALRRFQRQWGRFDVRLSGARWPFRVIEAAMNLRSRITGIATGDQVLFVNRDAFQSLQGFADIALMEDIELSRRLRRICPPCCLRESVVTSSRRWERHGIVRTVLLMWWLRFRYWLGADPAYLASIYYGSGKFSARSD